MPLDGAFTALLLLLLLLPPLISGVSAVAVLPPSNVALTQQNLNVTVSWEYDNQQPSTRFRVNTTGSTGLVDIRETTEHHYDLTQIIWRSEERYMDNLYVTVTAIRGSHQSKPVQSEIFTFNSLKTAAKIWKLDFPPVEVIGKGSKATVSFRNPFHFYRELKQADKPDNTLFDFNSNLTSGRGVVRNKCEMEQQNCEGEIVFPDDDNDKCVRLKGWLHAGYSGGQVEFKETAEICAKESTDVDMITMFVTLVSVIGLIIIVLTVYICKEKAWTMGDDARWKLPAFLLSNNRRQDLNYHTVERTDIATVTLIGNQSSQTSVSSEEEEDHPTESLQESSAASDSRPPADLYAVGGLLESSSEELEAAGSISMGSRSDNECVSMEEEEEEEEEKEEKEEEEESAYVSRSCYDRPHIVQVDLGEGDMATGYTKR